MTKVLPIAHVVKGVDADGTPVVDCPNDALATLMQELHASPEVHAQARKGLEDRLKEIGHGLAYDGIPVETRKDTIYCLMGALFMLFSEEVSDFLDDAGYRYVGDSEH